MRHIRTELTRLSAVTKTGGIQLLFHELFVKSRPSSLVGFLRYALVATAGYIVDFGLLVLLVSQWHINYLIAATISFIFSVAINYALSRAWVFPASGRSARSEMLGVLAIATVGLILNAMLLALLTDIFGLFYIYSKLLATVAVFFWNFLARHYFLTRPKQATLEPEESV